MIFTLYLIGYGNEVPESFFDRLEAGSPNGHTWRVLDIRAKRQSWAYSYTAGNIERIFRERGHNYIWLFELGLEGDELINEQFGMYALEQQIRTSRQPLVLFSAKRLSSEDHRAMVAEMLAERLARKGDRLEILPL